MKLKTLLQVNKKKSDIPQLQSRILNELGIVNESKKRNISMPRLIFQLTTLLIIFSSVLIFGIQETSNDIYAFENYDEVMVTASSTAYYVYHLYQMDNSDETISHQEVVLSELPYMIQYFRVFESILATQKAFDMTKNVMDDETLYDFELSDLTSTNRRLNMRIRRDIVTSNRDEFIFEGTLEKHFQLRGSTRFENDAHLVDLTIEMNDFVFEFEYNDIDKTYVMNVTNQQSTLLNITFDIHYDAFKVPTLTIAYERNDVNATIEVTRSFRIGGYSISYQIHDEATYIGDIELRYMVMTKKYMVRVIQSDEEVYTYTLDRPNLMFVEKISI